MRGLARRIQQFNAEIKHLDSMLTELVTDTAPSLVGLFGVGTDTAATLLVAAGDNPTGYVRNGRGRTCVVSARSLQAQAKRMDGIA